MKKTILPNIKRIKKEEYLDLFENAIVEKYGFEYNSDNARISWKDLDVIRKEVEHNPYKFYYAEDAYKEKMNELKAYIEENLSNHDLNGVEICEEDLIAILHTYNEGYFIDLKDAIDNQLEKIHDLLDEKLEDLE